MSDQVLNFSPILIGTTRMCKGRHSEAAFLLNPTYTVVVYKPNLLDWLSSS